MAEATTSKPKGRLGSLLTLIGILVLVPVGGWFGLDFYMKKKAPAAAPASGKSEEHDSEGSKGHDKKDGVHTMNAPKRLPMPVAESPLVYLRGDPNKEIPPRIVTTNSLKVNSLRPEKITITFADTKKKRYAVTQLYLAGDDTETLLKKLNENQAVVFENVTNLLSGKFHRDTKSPGFRTILRSEVSGLVNHLLGSPLVKEVIIPEFITQ